MKTIIISSIVALILLISAWLLPLSTETKVVVFLVGLICLFPVAYHELKSDLIKDIKKDIQDQILKSQQQERK